ncbi:MAG: hypothetical protein KGH65_05145 [Candidatus Micrarchaeota archaeon]|nr:hypothetical protein [Candidatus Micrarchaeota archaeon]
MEELLCRAVTKLVLPAIRAEIALKLSNEHHYTQEKIADKIGIVQVAVGKYLKGKYSEQVKEVVEYIDQEMLADPIIEGIVEGKSLKQTEMQIDRLCNDGELLDFSMRRLMAVN